MKQTMTNSRSTYSRASIRSLILLGIFILAFTQCTRTEDPFEGPSMAEIYGEFAIMEDFAASTASIDFSTGQEMYFTARFSRMTSWKIEITSSGSGSRKIIEGRSRVLDASNASWDGSTTVFPVFKPGQCTAVLTVEADSSTHQASVNVTGGLIPGGKVVSDFETPIDPKWTLFVQTGANMSFKPESKIAAPVGAQYFDMGGAVAWDWLIGLFHVPQSAMGADGFDLPENADQVYFNVVLYRPDTLRNGFLLFRFSEDENGDGTFTEASEDQYAVEVHDMDPGWNIVSFKYADLQYLINGSPATPKGNGVKNPDKLNMLSCLLLADPSSGYAQVLMDYMVFTIGEPLKL
ncbi:MAG: hypothetical protein H6606_01390 [Flavobacteriales bacterium]|nr:hypothetical protein [Flavobacteriales bacterium]